MNIFAWIREHLFPTDAERVAHAAQNIEENIFGSDKALSWLRRSGWSATGGDVAAALRNPDTRDAAIFAAIQNFADCKDCAPEMLRRYTANGLNNGSTTHTYIINSGEGSIGRSNSEHQAVLVVDEGVRPPTVTLAFRGMNPGKDLLSPITGLMDALLGRKAERCQKQVDQFWAGAQGDITRIMNEVATRTGATPQITVAGHSYGTDAAARMVPVLAQAFPQSAPTMQMVGFGAMPSFTRNDAAQIYTLLGNDPARARQYLARNDWIRGLGRGCFVGAERDIACRTGHEYKESSQLEAMMAVLERQMAADPRHAEANARKLVEEFKKHPESVLQTLAAYTAAPPTGDARGLRAAAAPQLLA